MQKRQRNIFKTHPETENGDPSGRMPCIVHMHPENCTTMVAVQVIHTVRLIYRCFRELLGGPGKSFELQRVSISDSFNEYAFSNFRETVLSG